MKALSEHWQTRLTHHRDHGYWRTQKIVMQRNSTHVLSDQQPRLNFASNDYLNLATHPQVIAAFMNATEQYGAVGSGGSPAVSGYSDAQAQCEQDLATYFGSEKACIFSSGYLANLSVFTALFPTDTCVYLDRECHASLIDACRFTGLRWRRFRHNDVAHCRELLKNAASNKHCSVIVTEGVFSARGDLAPLAALKSLAIEFDALLIVDDTHGVGTLGEHGRGSLEYAGLDSTDADIVIGTFGKAFGGAGGWVLCSALINDMLRQFARPYMFNTALPPALYAAMRVSLQLFQTEPERRRRLQHNIADFQRCARDYALPFHLQPSAIQILPIGDAERALAVQAACYAENIFVGMLRHPTVAKDQACLRVSLSADHLPTDFTLLCDHLNNMELFNVSHAYTT